MAIYNLKYIDAFFIPSFYKMMINAPTELADLESVDPERHKSLQWMLDNSIDDAMLCATFSVDIERFGAPVTIDLIPGTPCSFVCLFGGAHVWWGSC